MSVFASSARFLSLGLALLASTAQAQTPTMPMVELTAGINRIEAEVASTPQMRARGLMYRQQMAQQRGMLFVFAENATHCMWMKNTYLPLSVAFLDAHGKVINIEDMQPQTEDNHCAAAPARFALEMNLGWFRERGIKSGDALRGVERLPAAR